VPHQYVGETPELHASYTLFTLYFRQQPVASHARKHQPGMANALQHQLAQVCT
jgi:hypothetical protein